MSAHCGPAGPADLPQLVELLALLFAQEADFAPDEVKQRRALQMILADASRGGIYVAREEGRVIAMATLLYTVSSAEGGRAALFEDLVVRPEYRGRGIGRALLAHVIEQAKADGVLRLTLLTDGDNERAQSLYRRLGFSASGMRPMRLRLGGPA
jgi:ribosomal protein S18 acetylase RimI-like enzyme